MAPGSQSDGSSASCSSCAYSWNVYMQGEPLATNMERHSFLYRCSECGTYYEVFPEERRPPKAIDQQQIAERFPDYREP